MHREYHPEDMSHLRAHAFEDGGGSSSHSHAEDHRPLFGLTILLGLLIGFDWLLNAIGESAWSRPMGIPLVLIAAILGGSRIVYGALAALAEGRLGADFALAQASIAALVLGDPFVAAEVVFIALLGEALEAITADRAMQSIHRLFDQAPRISRVRREGVEQEIPALELIVGDLVIVRAGEKIAVDGPIESGRSAIDESAMTGESIPVDKGPGDRVLAGSINQFGAIEVRAERVGHETTLGQVLRLVASAQLDKAPIQRLADRYARYFLPVVEGVALLTLILGYSLGWPDVWRRTVAVLVVACPCALVLATPTAVLASLAWLARHGVILKGGAALERLATCDTFAFDKTGTLTIGRPELASIITIGPRSDDDLIRLAAIAEQSSGHPLAKAVIEAATARGIVPSSATEHVTLAGSGVSATWRADDGTDRTVLVGNRRMMTDHAVEITESLDRSLVEIDDRGETPLIVVVDGVVIGLIGLRDTIRAEAHDVVHDLKHLKFDEIALLTGDRAAAAGRVARKTHIKIVESELLPADKARWITQRQAAGRRVAMVGDGINDAPALAIADVGIALAGSSGDLAAEAGDLVILGDPLRTLPDLVRLSRATVSVIRQNIIIFAFGLNALAMASATLGILGPVAAAILHQVGSLLVLLNAMRLLAFGDWRSSRPLTILGRFGGAIRRWDDRFDLARLVDLMPYLSIRRLVAIGVGLVAIFYVFWNLVTIEAGEIGLVSRFGRYVGPIGPGLHWRLPPPIEDVARLYPGRLRTVDLGFRSRSTSENSKPIRWESSHDRGLIPSAEDESLFLTGDGQLVELTLTIQYRVADRPESIRRYAYETAEADLAVRPLAESSARSIIGRRSLDTLLTGRRLEAERAIADLLQSRLDAYKLGLVVVDVAFQDLHPPRQVVDAYRDVSVADLERVKRINEGTTYQLERLALGRGQAASTLFAAEGDRLAREFQASGQADAFEARREARSSHPGLTEIRLHGEAISSAIAGKKKILIDPSRSGSRRHLILPELATEPEKGAMGADRKEQ